MLAVRPDIAKGRGRGRGSLAKGKGKEKGVHETGRSGLMILKWLRVVRRKAMLWSQARGGSLLARL